MTKCHKLGGRNNRNVFSHSSRGWYSNIKVLANSVPGEIPGEGSLSGRQMAAFLCTCTQTPPPHTHIHRERETSLESLLLRALISLGEGPNSMTSSDPTYLPETPSPIPAHWGLGLPHEFGGKHKGSVCNTNDTGIDSQDPPSILGPVTS